MKCKKNRTIGVQFFPALFMMPFSALRRSLSRIPSVRTHKAFVTIPGFTGTGSRRHDSFPCISLMGFTMGTTSILRPSAWSLSPLFQTQTRSVSTKQRRRWKVKKYHFKLRLKRTMRKMRVPYVSSTARGQVKKKPILYDFRPYMRRKLKRAER